MTKVTITLPEEAIWAARFACLFAMMDGDYTKSSRLMVRELFNCISDQLPDDLGVTITVDPLPKKP